MKKAQILSAIALAFALGVVAPVAGANAFEVKTQNNSIDTATGKATCGELNTAIASIKANPNYEAIKAIAEANAKFNAGDYADITAASFSGLKTHFTTVTAFTGNAAVTAAVTNAANSVASLTNANIEETTALLNAATSNETYYSYFVNLIEAIEDTSANKYSKLDAAVKAFNANVPGSNAMPAYNPNTLLTAYNATSVIDNVYGSGVAQHYKDVKGAVTAVRAQLDKAVAGKAAYAAALSKAGVLTTSPVAPATVSGVTRFADLNKDTNATVVQNLHDIADPANSYIAINSNWYGLYNTLSTLPACTEQSDEWTNFNTLWSLARTYKAATNRTSTNTKAIAEELIAYVAPSTTPDDTNNGSNAGDDTQDPSAPGTGLVGTAEGNAATTVSIVAGLATALTALGAGVVAYRSARRSNK